MGLNRIETAPAQFRDAQNDTNQAKQARERTETMNLYTKRSLALRATTIALLVALSGVGLYACEKKGPLERAGEKVDEKVDDAKRAVEDAAD
jgi:hypothetical protein